MSDVQPPSPAPWRRPLAGAEAGARHVLLTLGFGVVALAAGMILMGSLLNRLAGRVDLSWGPLPWVAAVLSDGAWVIGVLPTMAYVAARFMVLKPWSTALIAAASGLTFQIGLDYVSAGEELVASPVKLVLRLLSVAGGVVLTATAVKRGRARSQVAEARAQSEALKKKAQYEAFVAESAAFADRREKVPIAAPQPDAAVKTDVPEDDAAKNRSP